MRARPCFMIAAIVLTFATGWASAQTAPPPDAVPSSDPSAPPVPTVPSQVESTDAVLTVTSPIVPDLASFKPTDIRFSLDDLMDILQDRRHEGWVLAAYPDPKTTRPLIGAGFSLDLPAREHPQTDPLNPHSFLEPSSSALWQTAGLDADRLQKILSQFSDNLSTWKARKFRRKIPALAPQITEDEARSLLRIGIVQAVYNARGYCRNFDRLTGSQQMALTQLVYQMGFNLQEFSQFLSLINSDSALPQSGEARVDANPDADYWRAVQGSLIQSQWARLYRARAVSVIAMLDPQYPDAPSVAEHRISAILHPAALRRHRGHSASLQNVSLTKHQGRRPAKKSRHSRGSKARRK